VNYLFTIFYLLYFILFYLILFYLILFFRKITLKEGDEDNFRNLLGKIEEEDGKY
jgi:hypothetical protein